MDGLMREILASRPDALEEKLLIEKVLEPAEKTMEYHRGDCDKKEFAFGVIDGCANVAVSALSAEIGKRFIPNPMIGSIVGSLIGGGLYQLTKTIVLRSSSSPSDKERKEQAA